MSGQWTRVAEVGSTKALRFGGWLAKRLGPKAMWAFLWLPAFYFLVLGTSARRGSRQYLTRLRAIQAEGDPSAGPRASLFDVLVHLHSFAQNIYERILMWSGSLELTSVVHDGSGEIFELAERGRSALLLGAHLGNVDMLWGISRKYDLAINVVVFYGNAQRINAFFESLAPGARLRAIEIDPASVSAAWKIKACLDRGEFVVILADRLPPGSNTRSLEATFLGAPISFPASPFLVATVLGCPVYFAACLRTGDRAYRTIMRPLFKGERVARERREKTAQEMLERYVANLETFCREQPLQWFNFFEYWGRERA